MVRKIRGFPSLKSLWLTVNCMAMEDKLVGVLALPPPHYPQKKWILLYTLHQTSKPFFSSTLVYWFNSFMCIYRDCASCNSHAVTVSTPRPPPSITVYCERCPPLAQSVIISSAECCFWKVWRYLTCLTGYSQAINADNQLYYSRMVQDGTKLTSRVSMLF